ncbi:ABC transporter substrate-binding protein [Ruania alba]|uniref:Carbohydrate ABC transporter substrate-binding protein, CUT1 family n=1 Tax=Ruania alba TaxID=648782 RepID=A0A1H5M2T2_9MICO|nr:extracellular solute-binding protein [Ruania alba]SEE83057.1 carbohydrate ABC transporter substrate-binding protein, CUT1 family [Ruania alba]
MKRITLTGAATLAAAALTLTACSGDSGSAAGGGGEGDASAVDTITLAGWSLSTTPEFQVLADAYQEQNPDITVELKEYDATEYDTQMIADLAAGSAPDMYVLKNLKNFFTYEDGDQLLDLSEVAAGVSDEVTGLDAYTVDGATYAIPYRQDAWYLYYNKDLFDAAGIEYPDGSWTWDDYAATAEELTTALDGDALGTYQHSWQSTLQGFANAQAPGADLLSGDWEYLVPFYERVVELQEAGAQMDFGAVTTNSVTYQSQFGTQQTAMMPMGSWYVATLLAQQESGDADEFAWGFAPAPQVDASTTEMPVTFADPTGIGINPAVDADVAAAAKDFLAFVASEDAAAALAEIGITPAITSDTVTESFFSIDGIPTDETSQFAFSTHEVLPENPVAEETAALQNILNDAHSAILAGTVSPADGIAEAMERAQSEVLG